MGQAFGGSVAVPSWVPRRPYTGVRLDRKGLMGATRKAVVTGALRGLVSELILNAEREMGRHGRRGVGEEAGLRSYLDSWLSSELFRAGASKPSALSRVGARVGRTHKVGMHYSGGIARRSSERLQRRSLLPQKPIVKNYKQTGWKSYSHLAAGEIQVITGSHALAAEKFRSKRQHECH